MLSLFRILTIACAVLTAAVGAQAQMVPGTASTASSSGASSAPPALPDPLTPDAVQAMVARMSDDQVRGMLLDRLDAVAQEQSGTTEPDTFTHDVFVGWQAFSSSITTAVQRLPVLISGQGRAIGGFFSTYGVGGALLMFLLMAVILGVAYGAEKLVAMQFKRWQ